MSCSRLRQEKSENGTKKNRPRHEKSESGTRKNRNGVRTRKLR